MSIVFALTKTMLLSDWLPDIGWSVHRFHWRVDSVCKQKHFTLILHLVMRSETWSNLLKPVSNLQDALTGRSLPDIPAIFKVTVRGLQHILIIYDDFWNWSRPWKIFMKAQSTWNSVGRAFNWTTSGTTSKMFKFKSAWSLSHALEILSAHVEDNSPWWCS